MNVEAERSPSLRSNELVVAEDRIAPRGLHAGDILSGRYRIEQVIGLGGNGAVHRAVHLGLEVPVAIKLLHLDRLPEADAREHAARFEREARTTARIRHRNVLTIHDTGRVADGSPYLVMELIDGEDLEQRLERGPLSIAAIVDLGRQLFAGLTAIAEAGVLHRDVKPANLMLHHEADGQVLLKLVDFGIARASNDAQRLTVTGVIVGTPHYMAPEQLRGEELDPRSDLYGACAVMYEAIAGRPPFNGPSTPLVIGRILGGQLTPLRELRPDCPAPLALLVERGLSRTRDARPAHPLEVVRALDRIVCDAAMPTGALAWAESADAVSRKQRSPAVGPSGPSSGALLRSASPTMDSPLPSLDGSDGKGIDAGDSGGIVAPPLTRRPPLVVILAAALALLSIGGAGLAVATRPAPEPASAPALPTVATSPSVDALLDEGLVALTHGEVDAALAHYRAACAADPSRLEAVRGRGLAAARAGLDDEAILAFERYLALAPDAADAERLRERVSLLRRHRSERLH